MPRMGEDQKFENIYKWERRKERKKKAPREERRGTGPGSSLRAEESALHGEAWGGHHYTKINSFSASSPESLHLLPWWPSLPEDRCFCSWYSWAGPQLLLEASWEKLLGLDCELFWPSRSLSEETFLRMGGRRATLGELGPDGESGVSSGREAVLGFWGIEGRAEGLGLGDWRRGFGLVGMLEELRDLQPPSTLGSALAFFSGVPEPKRASGRPGCSLGTVAPPSKRSVLHETGLEGSWEMTSLPSF